jgi:hypothetical protein
MLPELVLIIAIGLGLIAVVLVILSRTDRRS